MDKFDECFHSCPIDGFDESNGWTSIYSLYTLGLLRLFHQSYHSCPMVRFNESLYSCPMDRFDESYYSCSIDECDESNDWTSTCSLP